MTKRHELPLSRLGQAMFNSRLDSYLFMVQRFPRLVKRMQAAAVLSTSEAGCALRDYVYARDMICHRDLMVYGGGEAVCHFGGPLKLIRVAFRRRRPMWVT